MGGGNLTWVQGTSTLAWTSDIQILSTITGHTLTVAADSLTLDDGEIAYVNVVRSPTTSSTRTPQVSSQIQSSDNAYLLAIRVGGNVYFRNGQRLADGETLVGLGTGPTATGGSGLNTQGMGEWRFDTDTADSDPGSGKWKLNNADETAATFIYMNDQNISGLDASKIIQLLATGSLVYIQRTEDSTEALLYEVSGAPTDGTGYWKIPVTYESEDTAGWAGENNKKYAFVFGTTGGSGTSTATQDGNLGRYKYDSSTSGPPGNTYVRFNTTSVNALDEMYISNVNNRGVDFQYVLQGIQLGDSLRLVDPTDFTKQIILYVTGNTDEGIWHTITLDDTKDDQANSSFTFPTDGQNLDIWLHKGVGTNPLSGSGAPGVSTGNGRPLGTAYVDTTANKHYSLVDATTDANVWDGGATGGGGQQIVLATNEIVQLDQTEIVIGGGYIDGSTGGTYSWEALAEQIDGGGGVLLLTSEIRLYDMGPDGTPAAGTLRSTLGFPTDDALDRVSLTLTAGGSPGTDTDTIFNTARMYEVRAYLDSTGGNVDSFRILNVRFVES